ncbi:hypothetical protein [Streptomyces meridianus]|uniref:Lipoprotein n=1 Tax=Streptomyces meridianus TaxID=2938945 RepID=A0ABT0X602_9ACTN|nr:hypothetical protein [Streptomyces meridianus]MCM2577956.1 hypothetical protein [Streptomyces meridianus]
MDATRRRLRSGTVILGSVSALAAMLTACSSEADKRCVDRNSYEMNRGYKVLDSSECRGTSGSGSSGSRYGKSRGFGKDAAWYYDADIEKGYAEDGSFTKRSGGSSVHRGGFGSKHGSSGG